ncbi:FimV/HubP family polar landmark protein [Luteibacter aegosomatissinici]|uniref:FimV/HubP family polar landmark protein n=1 Tax=Luteibacter aegosomatissinici TaxID=2911539 RepID=UPI001FF88ED7|nr:FimV/HubP family polar landmark protein [Luteibacter aegosomatissinici]UPG96135.1 fimbrial protein FimV [Luteibacter aegosomatissinici]
MNRTLKLSIMLALAMGGSQALAQSLGAVQVHSTMDQPLSADIPLTGVTGNPGDIKVALASDEAFSRAGLNKSGMPVQLSFTVGKNAAGQPVIHVTSGAPVRDTYLDFLVEVSSGKSGSAIREVTMLLDPPGTPATPAANSAPASRPSRTEAVPARVPARAASPRATSSEPRTTAAPSAQAANGSIGPVQRGQTLSTIARDNANGADLNQVLVALHKANPDAFYRDNINALKTGAVLRMPSQDDIQAQSAAAALAEVRRQNEAWRSGAARAPASVADGAATESAAPAKSGAAKNDRLALVPAKEGGEAASTRAGVKGGTGDAQVAGLKQDLSTSQEAVASLKQQGAELKSRIGDLEAINTKNERLLSLKDSEIAELQHKLAEARKNAGQPAAAASVPAPAAPAAAPATAPATAQPVAAATPAPATSAPAANAPDTAANVPAHAATVATAPVPAAAAAQPATPPAEKPLPKKVVPAPAPVEEDPWFMQPWAWGGCAVVILLLLVAAVFGRRKKPAASVAPSSLADRFGREPTFGNFDAGHDEAIDTDQREIIDALAEHPDDIGLHLELVSLYYGRRDVDHFEAAAEAMYAHVADPEQPEWREVVMMGEELAPSHPLFGGQPVDAIDDPYEGDTYVPAHDGHENAEALEAFDLGSYVTSADEDAHPAPPAPQKHSEYHFNFDLTPAQRTEADRRPHAPDVFDVDAPESPYTEANDVPAFGDILAGEKAPAEERSTWSFDEEVPAAPVAPSEPPRFDEPTFPDEEPVDTAGPESFSDDPVDTKLDLARAYLDMGDNEGARLMLDEVISEGTQMQKDTARRILDGIA